MLSISLYGDEQDLDTIAGLRDAGGDRGGCACPSARAPHSSRWAALPAVQTRTREGDTSALP